jgi:lipopolysaccharide/colanic/teichoic acid biosynthesis glycosyltransferase
MGSTALSSIHTTTTSTRGKAIQYRKKVSKAHAAVDIRPVPIVQAIPALAEDGEVLPAERSEIASRVTNVMIASIALIALLPVMLLVALAVRLTSRGPVVYSQVRIGVDRRFRRKSNYDRRGHDYGGLPFKMYKFRTMRVDAESDGKAVWAQKNDPRITSIGMILRKTRLDELPQLYNVLRGDMNIVGPRPERPTIFDQLREDIPLYAQRQRVKPGITGWAQINQAYDSCLEDVRNKVRFDLEYVQRRCRSCCSVGAHDKHPVARGRRSFHPAGRNRAARSHF